MDELRDLCALRHDLFSTAEARSAGTSNRRLSRLVEGGELVRVRHGFYTLSTTWRGLDAVGRHLLEALAVLRSTPGVALSHLTGSLAHRVESWTPDLRLIHVTRLDRRPGGVENGVAHHESPDATAPVVVLPNGLRTLGPCICVAGAMTTMSVEQAVVAADSALRRDVVDGRLLRRMLESWTTVPGSRAARLAARLMDPRAGSVLETRTRVLAWRGALRKPDLQVPLVGPHGQVAYGDLGWRDERVIVECDGKGKYLDSWREGESPADVVMREKERENWITELGWIVRRVTWPDLAQPRTVLDRINAALALGSRPGAPGQHPPQDEGGHGGWPPLAS